MDTQKGAKMKEGGTQEFWILPHVSDKCMWEPEILHAEKRGGKVIIPIGVVCETCGAESKKYICADAVEKMARSAVLMSSRPGPGQYKALVKVVRETLPGIDLIKLIQKTPERPK